MNITCLSKGSGFHFPSCYIIDVSGIRILIDCPMDLAALKIFSPVSTDFYCTPEEECSYISLDHEGDIEFMPQKRQKVDSILDAQNLIHVEPWYKTAKNLHLWDLSCIDIVLITSSMGMLGLPYLTKRKGFCAKIYATEATSKLGHLMMEDLVSMHLEFQQFFGPQDYGSPNWMKWEVLESKHSLLKDVILGKNGLELAGWMPLYRSIDVKSCMSRVQTLKYAEAVCYNGTLVIKAFSSGLEIGSCNWTILGPKGNIAYISSSVHASTHAMEFDYCSLKGSDLVLYSVNSSQDFTEGAENENTRSPLILDRSSLGADDDDKASGGHIHGDEEILEEREKLDFVCSCVVDSVKSGGSVLIPMNRIGTFLQLLEHIAASLESANASVPIYMLSSVAAELLAYTNTIPEWLCKQRQQKLFAGEPLFAHVELIKQKKLHVFPAIHSSELLTHWQEPCIVFSPQWSLRLGPAVHLLQRWCGDQNSLLILEDGLDVDMALLPFKPMEMKVLKCSFLSGMRLHKARALLKALQPKIVLCSENLKKHFNSLNSSSNPPSIIYYGENETVTVPNWKEDSDFEIATDLVTQLSLRKLKQDDLSITRIEGQVFVDQGKHRLLPTSKLPHSESSTSRQLLLWGLPDLKVVSSALSKMGITGSIAERKSNNDSDCTATLRVERPSNALIEVGVTSTVISSADERLASTIFKVIVDCMDSIGGS